MLRRGALIAIAAALIALGGCGADTEKTTTSKPVNDPEVGTQAHNGFPGAGNPSVPAVTTTPGATAAKKGGKAGGGSSATCIGC